MRNSFAALSLLVACRGPADPTLDLSEGRMAGGDAVRIEGEAFLAHGPPVIHFGRTPAKAIVVESDRLLRLQTPEVDAPGTVDVTVTFADGTQFVLPSAFTFHDRGPAIDLTPRED